MNILSHIFSSVQNRGRMWSPFDSQVIQNGAAGVWPLVVCPVLLQHHQSESVVSHVFRDDGLIQQVMWSQHLYGLLLCKSLSLSVGQGSPVSGGGRQVDSVPEVQQDAVAAVELSVAAVADELGQTGVCVHGHSEQLLEVCAEERVDGAGLALQLRKRLPQTPRGELPVTQPTEARAHPACQRSEVSALTQRSIENHQSQTELQMSL